jgi:Domain of unknown function (DUF1929)
VTNNAKKRRRRKTLRIGALLGAIVLGNGPIIASYASNRYQTWQEHQTSYERQYGRWDTVADSHLRSVHAAMLDNGKVLLMSGSGNDQAASNSKTYRTMLWDPEKNTFTRIATPWDVFCSGHTFLQNGSLLIAGGTAKYEVLAQNAAGGVKQNYTGVRDSFVYDPNTNQYTRVGYLNHARWYPTLTRLADGSVIAVSGLDANGNLDNGHTESYDPTQKIWVDHPSLHKVFPTYPALLVTGDGRLLFTGSNAGYGQDTPDLRQPGLWNLQTNTFQKIPGLTDASLVQTSGSILLPPAQAQRYMILGGGGIGDSQVTTARTAIVDTSKPVPTFTPGPNLTVPKRYPGAVILPDDSVLVSGGSKAYRANDTKTAQLYHVDTNTFTTAADPHVGRDYHSEYVLLPDGRVAVFGSNPLSDNNTFETRVETYSPPYLFKGPRPTIVTQTGTVSLGQSLSLTVTGGAISKVRLIAPGSYTHVTDTNQRSVALPITSQQAGQVTVSIPTNADVLLPGVYMLFVDNSQGVPSVASWVHVQK